MKRWAVGFISFFDNEMSIVIVEAVSWKDALVQHPKIKEYADGGYFSNMTSLEDVKRAAFDTDSMCDVVEII